MLEQLQRCQKALNEFLEVRTLNAWNFFKLSAILYLYSVSPLALKEYKNILFPRICKEQSNINIVWRITEGNHVIFYYMIWVFKHFFLKNIDVVYSFYNLQVPFWKICSRNIIVTIDFTFLFLNWYEKGIDVFQWLSLFLYQIDCWLNNWLVILLVK